MVRDEITFLFSRFCYFFLFMPITMKKLNNVITSSYLSSKLTIELGMLK